MKKLIAFFLIITMIACNNKSTNEFSGIEEQLEKEYSSKTSGISLSVVSDSLTIWSESFGMADIKNNKKMSSEHILNIASVSKLFVATAIMQLSEQGLISINDDINIHLPFKVSYAKLKNSPIRIHHLLTHRSTIIDSKYYENSYTTEPDHKDLSDWIENYLSESGTAFSSNNFSEFNPGENWNYSNLGFGLLALIVENISNTPFEVYCEKNIFTPLKMSKTAWKESKDTSLITMPYAYFDEAPKGTQKQQISKFLKHSIKLNSYLPITPYHFPNYPDGLLFSSVEDLSKFAQCILNDGFYQNYQLLKIETINQMFEIQGASADKQGLCWRYTGFGNIWGHGGDDPGVQTGLYLDRKNKRAMVLIKNSNLGSRTKVIKEIYKASLINKKSEEG